MKLFTTGMILSLILLLIGVGNALALELGEKPPLADVKMKNVDGKMLSIADVKGEHGTLVIFSCNHCPWVVAWEERIASIGNAYQQKGFGVIVINSNDPQPYPSDEFEPMVKRAKKLGFEFPYVVDVTSDHARAFSAERTPEIYLFDKEDKLVYHGAIDDNAEHADQVKVQYLKDALDALAAGKIVSVSETKALGCGIKFRPESD